MLKKEISMGFRLVLIGCLILTACVSTRNKEKNALDVNFEIAEANPHCGGAAPMPDDIYPMIEPYVGCELMIYSVNEDNQRGKSFGTITTLTDGKATTKLPKGKYQMWKPSKLLPFSEFIAKEKSVNNSFYGYKNEACFQEWYETPDFVFEVGEESNFKFVYHNRCFTSHHPCMLYTGPLPP